MKTKLSFLASFLFAISSVMAQDNSGLFSYYNSKIDAAVEAANTVPEADDVDANPVYAKLLVAPVLYNSVVEDAFAGEEDATPAGSEAMAKDEEREAVIDAVLMNVYRNAPAVVQMTEEELRSEKQAPTHEVTVTGPELKFAKLEIPDDVVGGMKTSVAKPKYWTTSGKISLTFTQNFISSNWYQGGESAQAMLAEFDFDLNYDDKDRITFKNHFDFDLGFATSKADTLHPFRTNTDRLRLESTFGYKLVKNLDVAAKMKLESQSLPNYQVNSPKLVSDFFAPFDANASIGLNYKPSIGKFNFEIYVAPLSAFNYKFVRFSELAPSYGMKEGSLYRMDYGTQIVLTIPTVRIFKIVDFWTRAEYYTDYSRVFFQWETKFDLMFTKYFKASLMFNARFDDIAPRHNDYGYWQIKELLTLGVSYGW